MLRDKTSVSEVKLLYRRVKKRKSVLGNLRCTKTWDNG